MNDIKLPEKYDSNFQKTEEWQKDPNKWNNPRTVYLASADAWLGMEYFLNKHNIMQCENYYSVVGGMSGLNLLPYLNKLKKIIFYDANAYAMRIIRLHIELIRISNNIDDYISNIYQRQFLTSKINIENQQEFLQSEKDIKILNFLKTNLTPYSYETYMFYYEPYMTNLNKPLYYGPTIHCTRLVPYLKSYTVTDQMVNPFTPTDDNKNAFFVGQGWLKDNETYLKVKKHFLTTPIECYIGNIEDITHVEPNSGIYGSNIWSTHPNYSGWKKIINKFLWFVGYDDNKKSVEVEYYDNGYEGHVNYNLLFGKNDGNVHGTCCQAIDYNINLNSNRFLEVIEPHVTDGMNYGFRFYRGQVKIKTSDYLNTPIKDENIIAVHILLGQGVKVDTWYNICKKAVNESKRYVIIFEHRKECKDWPEWDVNPNHLIPHKELDEKIFSLDYRWKKFGCANIKGNINDVRNIMYFLDKNQ